MHGIVSRACVANSAKALACSICNAAAQHTLHIAGADALCRLSWVQDDYPVLGLEQSFLEVGRVFVFHV